MKVFLGSIVALMMTVLTCVVGAGARELWVHRDELAPYGEDDGEQGKGERR